MTKLEFFSYNNGTIKKLPDRLVHLSQQPGSPVVNHIFSCGLPFSMSARLKYLLLVSFLSNLCHSMLQVSRLLSLHSVHVHRVDPDLVFSDTYFHNFIFSLVPQMFKSVSNAINITTDFFVTQ